MHAILLVALLAAPAASPMPMHGHMMSAHHASMQSSSMKGHSTMKGHSPMTGHSMKSDSSMKSHSHMMGSPSPKP